MTELVLPEGVKPYYQEDGIVIYHGDCRDVLPTLEAGSVDLVLTDPPYGGGQGVLGYRVSAGMDGVI